VNRDPALRDAVLASAFLIKDEINVKDVEVSADESAFATVTVKPNFKTLGKRLGPKLKEVGDALRSWTADQVVELERGGSVTVAGEALTLDDVLLQRTSKGESAVATDGRITVALDTHVDAALAREGIAREFVSLLQGARKDAGLEVSDRIQVAWACSDDAVRAALEEHREAIAKEVLAVEFHEGAGTESVEINKVPVKYTLTKRD